MINSRKIEALVTEFDVELIKANGSDTLEKANKHLRKAESHLKELESIVPKMKQAVEDITKNIYNKFKND